MNRNFVSISAFLVLCLLVTACNMPEGYPTQVVAGDSSPTPTVTLLAQDAPSLTPTVVPGAAPVVNCSPTVTTNTDANVRSGPGQVYGVIGYIPTGGSAPVAGKNSDGTWW